MPRRVSFVMVALLGLMLPRLAVGQVITQPASRLINLLCDEPGGPRPPERLLQEALSAAKRRGAKSRYDVWRGAAGPHSACLISAHVSHREWVEDNPLSVRRW